MRLLRQISDRSSRSADRARALRLALVLLCLGIALGARLGALAQLPIPQPPASAAPTTPAAPRDSLGRDTPRGSMTGLLKYLTRRDFETSARYLQPTPNLNTRPVELASEFLALRPYLKTNIGRLSDDPNGTIDFGLPEGKVRAGVVTIGTTRVDVILVRVKTPDDAQIWLVSSESVAKMPELYRELGSVQPGLIERLEPPILRDHQLLGMSLGRWLGWLLSIPLSWLLAWLLAFLFSAPRRGWNRLRRRAFRSVWQTKLGTPLKSILAILIHAALVYWLSPPLIYRFYYFRFLATLLTAAIAWLISRAADRGFTRIVTRAHAQGGSRSGLILVQRLTHVVVFIVAVLTTLAIFGLDVKTALAGLGIGGVAIALAAQKTLENLIGGISLLLDKAVRVGDLCRIGVHIGTVEDIGLRSLKLRTLDQNILVVPNRDLAEMQFENMTSRKKILINQHFSLRIETTSEQLRRVLQQAQQMLNESPFIETGTSRLRISGFAGASFDLELFAYGKTSDMAELTAIREQLFLKLVSIFEAAGTRVAAPTQLTYLSADIAPIAESNDSAAPNSREFRPRNTAAVSNEQRADAS